MDSARRVLDGAQRAPPSTDELAAISQNPVHYLPGRGHHRPRDEFLKVLFSDPDRTSTARSEPYDGKQPLTDPSLHTAARYAAMVCDILDAEQPFHRASKRSTPEGSADATSGIQDWGQAKKKPGREPRYGGFLPGGIANCERCRNEPTCQLKMLPEATHPVKSGAPPMPKKSSLLQTFRFGPAPTTRASPPLCEDSPGPGPRSGAR